MKKHCPNCNSSRIVDVHILSRKLPWWWWVECMNCHWCGPTKLFRRRAEKAWNKMVRRG